MNLIIGSTKQLSLAGQVALEVINDFLNAFKMDYTSSIFVHEGNLKDPATRSELAKKLNIADANDREPILFQMIKALTSGNVRPQRLPFE